MAKKTKKPAGRKPPTAKPSSRKAMKKLVARKTQTAKPAKGNKPRTRAAAKRAPLPGPKGKPPQKAAAPSGASALAKRLAAFSQQVVKEEEAPVAVRTFNEARAGIEKSKEIDVRTGAVKPVGAQDDVDEPSGEDDEELTEFEEVAPEPAPAPMKPQQGRPVTKPQMEPLTGALAVPKTRPEEDFRMAAPAPKGKKGAPPTKEDLGRIELRMQRGTTDKTIANANPDYLQRSFKKASQTGKTAARPSQEGKGDMDSFEVAMDKPERRLDASLADFGDVEVAQQTRKGKRTLGTLDVDDEKEKES
jgi:hypothetical protein